MLGPPRVGYWIEFAHRIPRLTSVPLVTDLPLVQHPILLDEIDQMLVKDAIE